MICKRLITKPGIQCGLRSIGLMPKDSATSLIASVSIPRQGVTALIYHGPGRRTIFQRMDHIDPLHGFKRFHYGGRDLRERHQKNGVNHDYFDRNIIKMMWNEHLSGKNNWQYHLWNILSFDSWYIKNKK